MDTTAHLYGFAAQDRDSSRLDPRCSAFRAHLEDALLILESLDPTSLNHLKQDENCKGVFTRLFFALNTPQLPFMFNGQNQSVQGRLNFFRPPPQIENPCRILYDTQSIASRTTGPLPMASIQDPPKEATIHFLKGNCTAELQQVVHGINGLLSLSETSCEVQLSSRGSAAGYISLACVPSSASFLSKMTTAAPSLSSFWTDDAIIRIRSAGTMEYGIRAVKLDELGNHSLFRGTSAAVAKIEEMVRIIYCKVGAMHRDNRDDDEDVYSDDEGLDNDLDTTEGIFVSETVAPGISMLSGNAGDLKHFVRSGVELSMRFEDIEGHLQVVYIKPFCLRY